MSALEPNAAALGWFALFAGVASLGFFVVSGAFPLSSRADLSGRPVAVALAACDAILVALMVAAALAYGFGHLRWTSIVIVSGLAVLFAPGLLDVWPERWRDGARGLAIVGAALLASLVLAQWTGGLVRL